MDAHEFNIDNVKYLMNPINAVPAWNALKKAATLLQGVDLTKGESGAVGALLASLGDPIVADIEKMILDHTVITDEDGIPHKLIMAKVNDHFNKHRTHMVQVLMEGVKYQFTPFFAGGAGQFMSLIPKK